MRDGATIICAQLLQPLVCAPSTDNNVRALLNIDLRIAFNEASRQAAFGALTGKASCADTEQRSRTDVFRSATN